MKIYDDFTLDAVLRMIESLDYGGRSVGVERDGVDEALEYVKDIIQLMKKRAD